MWTSHAGGLGGRHHPIIAANRGRAPRLFFPGTGRPAVEPPAVAAKPAYAIALMDGDGIGPEIAAAAVPVLEAAAEASGARLVWRRLDAGTRAYARTGQSVPPDALEV